MIKSVVKRVNRVLYGAPPTDAPASLDEIPLTRLNGTDFDKEELDGKVVLFVNVASKCGLTPQYTGLEEMYERMKDKGLLIVGVPCNQFLGQEPGTPGEIATFCSTTYGVTFPLLSKQEVNGANRSPLYRWLIGSAAGKGEDISWNFEKFLVSRDGQVVARFSPQVKPEDPSLVSAVERALG